MRHLDHGSGTCDHPRSGGMPIWKSAIRRDTAGLETCATKHIGRARTPSNVFVLRFKRDEVESPLSVNCRSKIQRRPKAVSRGLATPRRQARRARFMASMHARDMGRAFYPLRRKCDKHETVLEPRNLDISGLRYENRRTTNADTLKRGHRAMSTYFYKYRRDPAVPRRTSA